MQESEIVAAITDLIRGDGVRRATHELKIDSKDISSLFLRLLEREGYIRTAVEDIPIRVGERVPAFHVADGVAHFGWVFWEVFSPDRKRKLFGSHLKNTKGDWEIILARRAEVYACIKRKESMDVDQPSSL